jgi:hypothetical protein
MTRAIRTLAVLSLSPIVLSACSVPAGGETQAPQEQAVADDVPSCYAVARKQAHLDVEAPEPTRAVFVLVDETTGIDKDLRKTLKANVDRLLGPGTSFVLSTFSAFARGHYATTLADWTIEAPVPANERDNLSVRGLDSLDKCLELQQQFAEQQADKKLAKATKVDASTFSNSEVLASLTKLSKQVRESPADQKVVLIVSDLLEHSSATSFYKKQTLRTIDADTEMAKAEKLNLIGDFGGATVYVIGAGLLSSESGDTATRDVRALGALQNFWSKWFDASQARVGEMGEPDLVTPIRWADTKGQGNAKTAEE